MDTLTLLVLFVASTMSQGIKNSPPDLSHHQYQGFPPQLTRGVLSAQQQAHIFNDVQQHRFQLGSHVVQQPPPQQQQDYFQPHQQITDITYNQGFTPIKPPQQEHPRPSQPPRQTYPSFTQDYAPIRHQPQVVQQPPPLQIPQQPVHHQFVQPLQINSQFTAFNPHPIPVIAQVPQPNFNYQPTYQPQPNIPRAPEPVSTRLPTREPIREIPTEVPTRAAPTRPAVRPQPTYNQFEQNYVKQNNEALNRKKIQQHQQYLTEVTNAELSKYNNYQLTSTPPPYVIETQPPTTRKQKPLEAITFSSEENSTPKVVKYRIRPTKKPAEETTKKRGEKHQPELYNKQERQKLYHQVISGEATSATTTVRIPARRATVQSTTPIAQLQEIDLQEELQKQIQAQLSNKDSPYGTLKVTLPGSLTPEQIANLPQLALGDAFAQFAPGSQSVSTAPENLFLANPPTTQEHHIRSRKKPVKNVIQQQATTTNPALFEELTKGVLPPGADFEVIRQSQDGGLEPVVPQNLSPQKKVTFVILEEQPDGTVKVQGVRNNDGGSETDVDSILQKIQQGEIKLPPSSRGATPQESVASPSYVKHSNKNNYINKYEETYYQPTTTTTTTTTTTRPTTTTTPRGSTRGAYVIRRRRPGTTYRPSTTTTTTTSRPSYTANSHSGPPYPVDHQEYVPTGYTNPQEYTTPAVQFIPTLNPDTSGESQEYHNYQDKSYHDKSYHQSYTPAQETYSGQPSFDTQQPTYSDGTSQESSIEQRLSPTDTLHETLKGKGLYAMAKFLQQSGLDSVLNETGPYTIFVPTDKAFRTLLVQLGGPDRADQKFKENPRLLSGLLLHHVIPGAFSVDSLQDEMTGVSLAGTQLRVNTYTTQDNQWNDQKVVTINGARIVEDKEDIVVPQGVAHVVDRVMFPLPVGDIVQTLQADREQRFTKFIKILQDTGVAEMLTGSKTYTLFAPTDAAFPEGEAERLQDHRAEARSLVMRHITPGTLYSAGMHYYQLRDTMLSNKQISLFKEAGRVKANNAHVTTRNIPATNGVIHAIDSLL